MFGDVGVLRAAAARASVCLTLLGLVSTTPALAQSARTEAEELFWKGREASRRGDHAGACRLYAASYSLDAAPGTLFNLARCEEQRGRLAAAWRSYRAVIARFSAGDQRLSYATERAIALEKRLARLTVRSPDPAPSGFMVLRNGHAMTADELGRAVPVDPGAHYLEVLASGRSPRWVSVALAEGESREITARPGAEARGQTIHLDARYETTADGARDRDALAKARRGGSDLRQWVGWSAVGVGLLGLTTSAVAAAMVLESRQTFERECDTARACTSQGIDAKNAGVAWGTIGTVAFAVGAVSLGAGVYLVAIGSPSSASGRISAGARF